jgi:hypothetical protein
MQFSWNARKSLYLEASGSIDTGQISRFRFRIKRPIIYIYHTYIFFWEREKIKVTIFMQINFWCNLSRRDVIGWNSLERLNETFEIGWDKKWKNSLTITWSTFLSWWDLQLQLYKKNRMHQDNYEENVSTYSIFKFRNTHAN